MASYADVVVLRHPEPGAVSVSYLNFCLRNLLRINQVN